MVAAGKLSLLYALSGAVSVDALRGGRFFQNIGRNKGTGPFQGREENSDLESAIDALIQDLINSQNSGDTPSPTSAPTVASTPSPTAEELPWATNTTNGTVPDFIASETEDDVRFGNLLPNNGQSAIANLPGQVQNTDLEAAIDSLIQSLVGTSPTDAPTGAPTSAPTASPTEIIDDGAELPWVSVNSTNTTNATLPDFLGSETQAPQTVDPWVSNTTNGTGVNVTYFEPQASRRRLGHFLRNQMSYVRVAEEAVDIRLNWETKEELLGGQEKYFINPGMMFLDNEDGSVEWVRTVRYHSVGGYNLGSADYNGQQVTEIASVYFTSILLGSETFKGDLSGGFDDESISRWGLQTGEPLHDADRHMLANEDTYSTWEDLCEARPGFEEGRGILNRKFTTGAEDPKLFELPSTMNDHSRWALTFSSYPPAHALEEVGVHKVQDCKWSDYSKFQMYLAPGGEQLAHGVDSPAHRLSCGSMTDHEKNWIAFDYENELYYVQNVEPHVVMKVNGEDGTCEKVYESSSPYLSALSQRASVRGSATAHKYSDDEYIALLHTHQPSREPYTTRAYTFEAHPPFRVTRVSKPLKLQSKGLAFASSLTVYGDKFFVGYGVADRESRVMVMSRDYLESQFQGDCDGSLDRVVAASGLTCAEEVVGLMRGEEMMPPRRAMNFVGFSRMECRGLLEDTCEADMVLSVSRLHTSHNCNEALSREADGVTCSARMKWLIKSNGMSPERAVKFVADQFKECRDVVSLGCSADDLHFPDICEADSTGNNGEPAVLIGLGDMKHGGLAPMIQCAGISSASLMSCVSSGIHGCIEDDQVHLIEAPVRVHGKATLESAVSVVQKVSVSVGRRDLESDAASKVIMYTRNPLEIVFENIFKALADRDLLESLESVDLYRFQELIRSEEKRSEVHQIILDTMFESSATLIEDWELMKTMKADAHAYDVLMFSAEELEVPEMQPSILAEVARFVGVSPEHNRVLDGIQAAESMYSKRRNQDAIKSIEFYLEYAMDNRMYICHFMHMVPKFLQTTVELGYGEEIGVLTQYCPGFDEEWIVTAGDEVFVSFSDRE